MQTKLTLLAGAAILCLPIPASAQTYAMDRGVWVVGGSASVSHFDASGFDGGSTGISIYPDVGYFFVPGLLVLANVEYAHSSGGGTSTRYGAGPGLTYYFIKGPAKVHPYLAASVFFGHTQFEVPAASYMNYSESYNSWYTSGGGALLLARNVAVTGEAYYGQVHYGTGGVVGAASSTTMQYGIRFGLAVYIY